MMGMLWLTSVEGHPTSENSNDLFIWTSKSLKLLSFYYHFYEAKIRMTDQTLEYTKNIAFGI